MNKLPIYLDYMSTTPVDERIIPQMVTHMGFNGDFANSTSLQHIYGQQAAQAIAIARQDIADVVGAEPDSIIFTSGATEANNLAILGAARFYKRKGKHIITMTTEHKSCLSAFEKLAAEGYTVTYLDPMPNGMLDIDKLASAITVDTTLVSIMHVNNEIGTIQDIAQIGELLANKGIIFHVDAAQSAGKLAINLQNLNVNLMSLSAHKNYGPKGVGALYIQQRPRIRIEAQSYGGGQERGLRSGTLATHQIVGMAAAFKLSEELRAEEQQRILNLRDKLWQGIADIQQIKLNCDFANCIAGILNISFTGIDGEQLITKLHPIAISTMSACAVSSNTSSYVLKAIGISKELAKSSIRICVGRYTTFEDIENCITVIRSIFA